MHSRRWSIHIHRLGERVSVQREGERERERKSENCVRVGVCLLVPPTGSGKKHAQDLERPPTWDVGDCGTAMFLEQIGPA